MRPILLALLGTAAIWPALASATDDTCDANALAGSRLYAAEELGVSPESFVDVQEVSKGTEHDGDYLWHTYNLRFTSRSGEQYELISMLNVHCEIEEIMCWDPSRQNFCGR